MAKRRIDVDQRSDTFEENNTVLSDLRSRAKSLEHRSSQELEKLFAKLNKDGSAKHSRNAKISSGTRQEKITAQHPYGPLDEFPVGSWWGIRMDCSRDRVHEPFNRDIQEGRYGAVSLCTSHLTTNNDVDLGDWMTFTGGKYESGAQSDDPLLRSYRTQVPLRLVRSYNLTDEFAPKTGYRYDGLYTVVAHWIGVTSETEKYHKFALARVGNQAPPAWRITAKNNTSGRKPQTRCNIERFTSNQSSDSHPGITEEIVNNSRSRSETIKFSFNKSSIANGTDRISCETKKNLHDSAIVTRCISSKKFESTASSISSAPCYEGSSHSAVRHLDNSSKPPPCKLQNTNIAIRTDLYESYLHQDPAKTMPMTFCRTFKTSRAPNHIVKHSNVGTLNLNSCGPCPRDKEQESQIQSRSGIPKFASTQSPSLETNRCGDRSTPRINGPVATPSEAKTSSDADRTVNAVETSIVATANHLRSASNRQNERRLEPKRCDKENSPEKALPNATVAKSSSETIEKTETVCPITRTKSKESDEAAPLTGDEPIVDDDDDDQMLKGTLDSLTPDQMLKFIVKQKYHPRAKLLIGSVIGLATGESTILRAYDSLISRQKRWNRSQSMRGTPNDSTTKAQSVNESIADSSYECRQGTSGTSRKKDRSATNTISKKRVMKERMLKMRLRRTRVSKRSSVGEKKSMKKPSDSMSQRLRQSKISEKTQQPFSKSTILKKSQKLVKKRGGELARLVIDANIGPKVRGPRNRRLRGTTHVFARKKRRIAGDQDAPSCCGGGNSSDVGLKGKKGNARVELSSRRSKRLSSATKTRIPQSRYIDKTKAETKERIPRPGYAERKKTEPETVTTSSHRSYRKEIAMKNETRNANAETRLPSPASKGAKRKMAVTRTNSRDQVTDETSKRSCCTRDKSRTRSNRMVDAATQCSDRRDASTSVEREIDREEHREDHQSSIKVEWIDLSDVKSETNASNVEEISYFEVVGHAGESWDDDAEIEKRSRNILPIRPRAAKPRIDVSHSTSAFVPVNISDSDFRIARLRSIGFRPIEPDILNLDKDPLRDHDDYEGNPAGGSSKEADNATVMSRIVDEQYNKYTSEETDVVEYMDQELRYQDIEDEAGPIVHKNRGKDSKKVATTTTTTRSEKLIAAKSGPIVTAKGKLKESAVVEDDAEAPWHGWKKFIKNEQAHWIGW